ncbi:MAG TPA: hypothetical protein VHP36_07390 [Chitinispirillaceae bacterium]|nr:hypothetical protein [Chitinispirillaceae bacterium]
MKYQNQICDETVEQMTLPLFQPLRLWSPRPNKVRSEKINKELCAPVSMPVRTFTMRGGYISDSVGIRRMVIAGKIFKTAGALI